MALKYYAGDRITGSNSDRTGLTTTNVLAGTSFLETDTNDVYHWDGSSWDLVAGNSIAETLTNKTISGSSNTLSNIANGSLSNSAITIGGTSTSLGGTITALTALTDLDLTSGSKTIFDTVGANTLTVGAGGTTVALAGNVTI